MADVTIAAGNLSKSVPSVSIAALTALIAADAPLETVKVRLFKNDILPGPNNVIGDFTEADYTGYTAGGITVTWTTIVHDDLGVPIVYGSNCLFKATGDTVANTLYGYYVVDAGPAYLYGGRFPSPEMFTATGDSVVIVPSYQATTPAP